MILINRVFLFIFMFLCLIFLAQLSFIYSEQNTPACNLSSCMFDCCSK